jgi:hypothetical protein
LAELLPFHPLERALNPVFAVLTGPLSANSFRASLQAAWLPYGHQGDLTKAVS